MLELEHWHPVLLSKELKKEPSQILLHGKKILLYRNSEGIPVALEDACPHRRMPLSKGVIKSDKIQCIYHGLCFDKEGNGYLPTGEKSKIDAFAFDCLELNQAIWIKPKNSFASFPYFNTEGFHLIDISSHKIKAPLEIVLDNFTEVEHTPEVHLFLGYDPKRMNEITVETESTDITVRIKNIGPQKKIPFLFRAFLEIGKNDLFVDDWTTYFSPVYSVYEQYWIDTQNKKTENQLRIFVFFVPRTANVTELFAFTYFKFPKFGHLGLNLLIKPVLKKIVHWEIQRDKEILEKIEDLNIQVQGMKLSRFDRSLGPNRNKIKKIYKKEA